jgi:hypothetical protein
MVCRGEGVIESQRERTKRTGTCHITRHIDVTLPYFIAEEEDVRSSRTAMLEELSNMDRITQLQDEIQNASLFVFTL